ncbi:hypothetical protein BC936DRAFT_141511 [Jimgerdemannia flammicorona]|uniref:Secreted protein n=1 Tax=Jimgerdemannia flammicorona TaxID=994334 RepID=A0A433A235_9FUNG|nr:hypothetical protein BC936DRAFT_141511 [Jimgerdemannia flammicorona]
MVGHVGFAIVMSVVVVGHADTWGFRTMTFGVSGESARIKDHAPWRKSSTFSKAMATTNWIPPVCTVRATPRKYASSYLSTECVMDAMSRM